MTPPVLRAIPVRTTDPTDMLCQILFIRRLEEAVLRIRREGHISGSVHVCIGQECVPVATLASLDERDRVLATYRGHGWALACGVPPVELLGEILGRSNGTNGGRAGSAYLTAPAHGFIGENSIVGAGAPIANGVAMGLQARGLGGVAVVSIGDGATNQGSVHEAIVFAIARRLPVVFVCENNSWSEMTPIAETVPLATLRDRAAGYGITAVSVDGSDVRDLRDVIASAVGLARAGGGPSFIEVRVPRILGHYNGDIEQYRSDADRADHLGRDPMTRLVAELIDEGVIDEAQWEALQARVAEDVAAVEEVAMASAAPDPGTVAAHVMAAPSGAPVTPFRAAGEPLAYGLAVNRALHREMQDRPEMVAFGEDIAVPGGTFGVTRNLRKKFGERVFDTPIAEASILGAALGASLEGLLPVVEIMWTDFLFVAFDQVVNQMSNVRYISRGAINAPLVVRMQQGVTPGSCAQHSQSLEALLAHIPGIKVGVPSNPQDAYAMLRAAVADPDPVVLIESRALYLDAAPVDTDGPIEAVAGARLRRAGSDLLIVSWGRMAETSLRAAERLAGDGVDASVLDLRWLNPLDEDAIAGALQTSGGKLLIAHEANLTGGFGAEVAARISERHFYDLDAPIVRVGMPDVRVPSSPGLQAAILPNEDSIAAAARLLAGH